MWRQAFQRLPIYPVRIGRAAGPADVRDWEAATFEFFRPRATVTPFAIRDVVIAPPSRLHCINLLQKPGGFCALVHEHRHEMVLLELFQSEQRQLLLVRLHAAPHAIRPVGPRIIHLAAILLEFALLYE